MKRADGDVDVDADDEWKFLRNDVQLHYWFVVVVLNYSCYAYQTG